MPKTASPKIELKTDLGHGLEFREERVALSMKELRIYDDRKLIDRIRLKDIGRTYIEGGFGVNKLIVLRKDGKETEFAYFTKERSADFSRLSDAINDSFLKGKATKLKFRRERAHGKSQIGTLIWLYSFTRKYRSGLIIGLALSLLLTIVNLVPPYLLKVLIDNVLLSPSHNETLFPILIGVLLLSYVMSLIFNMLQGYILSKNGNNIVTDLRNQLFSHVVKLPPTFIDRFSTGRIISRLISDAGNTQWLMTYGLPTTLTNVLTLIGIGVILFSMYPPLAVYVLLPIPVIVYMVVRYKKRSQVLYFRSWRMSADMASIIADVIPNYTIVKAASKEKFESGKFNAVTSKYYDSQMRLTKLNIFHWPQIGFLTSLATVVIWWVGGHSVTSGLIELGVVAAFISYLGIFYNPINQLGNIIPFIQQSLTSGDRLREIMDEKAPSADHGETAEARPDGDIEFRKVSFEYTHPFPTIKNVDLRIRKGSKAAMVGKSGSGKTTIAKLLLRLYDINSGTITIGGRNISRFGLESLRSSIAYVPQEAVLFDNSVAYNVSYYSQSPSVDPLKIMKVCADANLHKEIMSMPLRYDTNIGEGGHSLSGGQRQRLSIARAMLSEPRIVLLDEVTSNLDAVNATEVNDTIASFTKGRTSISITHDENEIKSADYVIFVDNGTIIEQGTPRELLRRNSKLVSFMRTKSANAPMKRKGRKEDRKGAIAAQIAGSDSVEIRRGSRQSMLEVSYSGNGLGELTPQLPFPISHPEVIVFNDKEGLPLLLLPDASRMNGESASALSEALSATNLKFRITGIEDIKITGDGLEWSVKTEKGRRKVTTYSTKMVRDMGNKLVLIGSDGSVFEADRARLDSRSNNIIDSAI